MPSGRSFERLSAHVRGCPICGKTNEGRVLVQVQELENGQARRSVGSRSISFCEDHAVEVWEALAAALDVRARRGTP